MTGHPMGRGWRRAAAAAAVVLVAACTPSGAAPVDSPAEVAATSGAADADLATTLRWAIPDPAAITPHEALDRPGLDVVDLLFDSLTQVEVDGAVRPALATSWRSRNAGLEWTFDLDRQAHFHSGAPVVAADLIRGWEAAVQAGLPHLLRVDGARELRAGTATSLRGVSAPDDHTVTVRLSSPDTAFPAVVSHPSLAPVPAGATGAAPGDPSWSVRPIGNGPFAMAEPWARGRFIRLQRVAETGDDVREVVFETTDLATGYVRFQQGRVHVATVPGGALEEALERYGAAPSGSQAPGVRRDPLPVLVHLAVDVTRPPFDEVDVRRALSLAIDRTALVDAAAEGNARPARSIVPPAVSTSAGNVCDSCARDWPAARQLFAEAGIDELTITVESGGGDSALVDRLRDDLAAVGVELIVRRLPFPELLADLEAGEVTLARLGWVTERPDVLAAIAPLVRSGVPQPGAGVNYGGYGDAEVDDLLDAARSSPDARRRADLARAAERIALGRDQAVIPLYTERRRLIVDATVSGLELSPYGGLDLTGVQLRSG